MKKLFISVAVVPMIAGTLAFWGAVPANAHSRDRLPRGTIIAYVGTETSAPEGWEICGREGGEGFPNFGGRVLLGTYHLERVGKEAGSETHLHGVNIRSTDERDGHNNTHPEGADNWTGHPNWSHRHHVEGSTSETANIPPAIEVLFLCQTVIAAPH